MGPTARFPDGEARGREHRSFTSVLGAGQQRRWIFCGWQAETGRGRGGLPQTLAAAPSTGGGVWSEKGFIVYGPSNLGLYRIPAAGGAATQLTIVAPGQITHETPMLLPNGRLMYSAWGNPDSAGLFAAEIPANGPVAHAERLLKGGEYSLWGCASFGEQDTCTLLFAARSCIRATVRV